MEASCGRAVAGGACILERGIMEWQPAEDGGAEERSGPAGAAGGSARVKRKMAKQLRFLSSECAISAGSSNGTHWIC